MSQMLHIHRCPSRQGPLLCVCVGYAYFLPLGASGKGTKTEESAKTQVGAEWEGKGTHALTHCRSLLGKSYPLKKIITLEKNK